MTNVPSDGQQYTGTRNRVVITGLGTLNPCGENVAKTWRSVLEGVSGIGLISRFDTSGFGCKIGGEVKGFDPSAVLSEKELSRLDRFAQLAVAAAHQAMTDAEFTEASLSAAERGDFGVLIGSGIGGIQTFQDATLAKRVPSTFYPALLTNMASGLVSMKWRLSGPTSAVSTACASGAHAIGDAARLIRHGYATRMIAGGAEAPLTHVGVSGFDAMRALSRRNDAPTRASRPFDSQRDGFVMSEGAAAVVLESLDAAVARGANVYAELVGYGASADAHHVTAPHPEGSGAALAMRRALSDAGISVGDIGYINAHGTSTQMGDRAESNAIRQVFSAHLDHIEVGSTKSVTGHLLGAAGALEAVLTALAVRHRVAPPTLNLDHIEDCAGIKYTRGGPESIRRSVGLSNSFAFGGLNVCLALRPLE